MFKIGQIAGARRLATVVTALAVSSLLAAFTSAAGATAGASAATLPVPGAQASTLSWHLQNPPTPPGATLSYLTGVSCTGSSPCLAVGNEETTSTLTTAFAERWNGTAWKLLDAPNASKTSLNAVVCRSRTFCVAVGNAIPATNPDVTMTLAEVWNGSTWTAQTTPNPKGTTHADLTGVSCTSAIRCTAVGWFTRNFNKYRFLLAERWNGSTWKLQTVPNPSGAAKSQFNAVSCASAGSCVAVGDVFAPTSDMLAASWNGMTWTLQATAEPGGSVRSDLQGVSCLTTTACIATGYWYNTTTGFSLAETWDGTSWTVQSTPNPAGAVSTGLGGVSCASANMCVSVGGSTSQTATTNVAEIWDGSAWTLNDPGQPSGAAESSLTSVSCPSTTDCTAVGSWSNSPTGTLVPEAAQYS